MSDIYGGSLKEIVARFQCGGCGKIFEAELDEGYKAPADWSLFDVAVDQVSGTSLGGSSSIQGGYILCAACTRVCDEEIPEEKDATRENVERVLESIKP